MKFKMPNFWFNKSNFASLSLLPLSLVYYFFFKLIRKFKKEQKIDIPVLCFGNLIVGGTGKTPVSNEIRKLLKRKLKFKKIFLLSRGYGGILRGPIEVKKNDKAIDVGDEAIIHRKTGPVCVSKNKIKGAKFCLSKGADMLILDDGFQSVNIIKDLSFIIVDSKKKFGNERIIPSGPLRETTHEGLARADAIIFLKNSCKDLIPKIDKKIKTFHALREIEIPKLVKKNIYVFCGIGSPDIFFDCLENMGFKIVLKKIFADHHNFLDFEVSKIIEEAKKKQLDVVTTQKDFIKINPKYRKKIFVAKLKIKFHSEKNLLDFIKKKIKTN